MRQLVGVVIFIILSNPLGWALGALGLAVFVAVGISAGLSMLLHPDGDNPSTPCLPQVNQVCHPSTFYALILKKRLKLLLHFDILHF
ncbi:MAG: hypothetical protein EBY16_04690 [Gammaproteobacteria bacterium]|nr:hypothetical protein [Gammaproteobacteria bacterium]